MNYSITTKGTSGSYTVSIYDNSTCQEIGVFATNNSSLVDDISRMKSGDDMLDYDTEQELIDYCLDQLN